MNNFIKSLSLECLGPQTVLDTPRNCKILNRIAELDVEFIKADKGSQVDILAEVYDLCIIIDVM